MIPDDIRGGILLRLRRAEAEHGVRILFAIESGSRAWGFASPNGGYDVRFVYAREPSWYQAVDLEERRDVNTCIEAELAGAPVLPHAAIPKKSHAAGIIDPLNALFHRVLAEHPRDWPRSP